MSGIEINLIRNPTKEESRHAKESMQKKMHSNEQLVNRFIYIFIIICLLEAIIFCIVFNYTIINFIIGFVLGFCFNCFVFLLFLITAGIASD